MKILAGTHGTGKSTLLKAINEKYPDYFTSDGFSRPVKNFKKEYTILSDKAEQMLINELTIWAFENYVTKRKVISTRSPIDAIVYSHLLTPGLDVSEIEKRFLEKKDQIETIFFIPVEFAIEDDGVRFVDIEFQKKIECEIISFLLLHKIPYVKLTGSVEERLAQIEPYL